MVKFSRFIAAAAADKGYAPSERLLHTQRATVLPIADNGAATGGEACKLQLNIGRPNWGDSSS